MIFLPNEVKNILDLSTIKVEQESFVEAITP
ncbi:transposase, YhgA-like family protein [Orientia tsutsugamushi str. UT76]|nr:transposase, YhgA-like family protein [Orientia tsutsugamushi str. UT76]